MRTLPQPSRSRTPALGEQESGEHAECADSFYTSAKFLPSALHHTRTVCGSCPGRLISSEVVVMACGCGPSGRPCLLLEEPSLPRGGTVRLHRRRDILRREHCKVQTRDSATRTPIYERGAKVVDGRSALANGSGERAGDENAHSDHWGQQHDSQLCLIDEAPYPRQVPGPLSLV
ncbi:hypothetical protein K402DRAFT_389903 [Aulographum hederae CBS 113979]|uniref:Uncharacterized protein n=1 Tax=Aulographum hederae CBS 113979 TaxID=1176131 RepID=A0A6G1HB47_9PEZI|nr:hypothetical protein K402DRAFT_389903 [Aulographum hederae CBS 113979]